MKLPISAWVAMGSLLGSLSRYSLQLMIGIPDASQFPWATLAANTLGSLLIGWIAGLKLPTRHWLAELKRRQFVMTGFCGGFTTFSIFSLQTLQLMESGEWGLATANVVTTSILMMIAVTAGYGLALLRNAHSGNPELNA